MQKLRAKTVIISDVHLGTSDCRVEEVNHFLKHVRCEKLILNGDIIDGWQLRRSGSWTKQHSRFIRIVLKMLEKRDTQIVYLRGNHDDILARFLPLQFENLEIVEQHIHEGAERRYLVLHGDVLDAITMKMVWLSHLGDFGYQLLMRLNRVYNGYRAWRGLEYYSISKAIKARVKGAVNFVSKFEDQIVELARRHNCTGVMCGHIHTAADKVIGGIHYLNSGDWVESLTALVEHHDGRFELIDWEHFQQMYPLRSEEENEAEEPLALPAAAIPVLAKMQAA
ncbi:MAG: UDP-2,3-diacylglucosamine diphosphatase [Opitutaceae bacterium]